MTETTTEEAQELDSWDCVRAISAITEAGFRIQIAHGQFGTTIINMFEVSVDEKHNDYGKLRRWAGYGKTVGAAFNRLAEEMTDELQQREVSAKRELEQAQSLMITVRSKKKQLEDEVAHKAFWSKYQAEKAAKEATPQLLNVDVNSDSGHLEYVCPKCNHFNKNCTCTNKGFAQGKSLREHYFNLDGERFSSALLPVSEKFLMTAGVYEWSKAGNSEQIDIMKCHLLLTKGLKVTGWKVIRITKTQRWHFYDNAFEVQAADSDKYIAKGKLERTSESKIIYAQQQESGTWVLCTAEEW